MKCPSRFGQRCWPPLKSSVSNVASVAERQVRFTEQFFDRIDTLLPSELGEWSVFQAHPGAVKHSTGTRPYGAAVVGLVDDLPWRQVGTLGAVGSSDRR